MGGFLLQAPIFTGWSDTGEPLSGGLLYAFDTGTATPAATYQDQALSVLHAHPIVLNGSGRATVFVPDASVKIFTFTLKTAAGVLVYSVDGVGVPSIPTPAAAAVVPPGTILAYGAAAAPATYLLCDGASYTRSTFQALFDVIGTVFGSASGSTFNVPDLRGRFPLGKAVAGTGSALGATGGALGHTHTGPSHTHLTAAHEHTITHTHSVPRDGWGTVLNNPPVSGRVKTGDAAGAGSEATAQQATADNTSGASSAANSGTKAATATDAGGTGATGPTDPAFISLNWIIKT